LSTIKRTYLLGEEWLYYKIYCGVRSADAILANELSKLTKMLFSKNLIEKWFFIRYKDPENHLRLRLKLTDTAKLGKVVGQFNDCLKPLLDNELVYKIQTETYSRELERYGTATMEISEAIFFYQSEMIVKLLQNGLDEETYFIDLMQLINQFIACFDLSEEESIQFLNENANVYKNEFKLNKQARIDINKKFRKLEPHIKKEFSKEFCFNKELKKIKVLVKEVLQLEKNQQFEVSLKSYIASHVHMMVNRAFRDRQRFFELLIFKYLTDIRLDAKSY